MPGCRRELKRLDNYVRLSRFWFPDESAFDLEPTAPLRGRRDGALLRSTITANDIKSTQWKDAGIPTMFSVIFVGVNPRQLFDSERVLHVYRGRLIEGFLAVEFFPAWHQWREPITTVGNLGFWHRMPSWVR